MDETKEIFDLNLSGAFFSQKVFTNKLHHNEDHIDDYLCVAFSGPFAV